MKCSNCAGDECSGLCSLFEEFDDDGFGSLTLNSAEIDDALSRAFFESSNAVNQDDAKIEGPTEKNKATHLEESSEGDTPVKPGEEEPRCVRKRKNEKNRRSQVNEGFDELEKLIFHIDPQLKAAAQARAAGISKSKSSSEIGDTKLLGRVELVNTAVATLTRIHQEDEFHKNAIAQYATGQMASIPLAPNFDFPSLLDLSSAEHDSDSERDDETKEARAARKRKREKRRRDSVNAGLDQLMNLIFLVDPEIKVAAEEKAQFERSVGRRNSSNYLLSRVELMKVAVETMARSHQDNEVHRSILAHLSAADDQATSVTPVSSDNTEGSVDTNDPVVSDASDTNCIKNATHTFYPSPPPEVVGLTSSRTDLIHQQPALPLAGEHQVDERALNTFLGESEQFSGFDEATGGEPVAKRLKTSSSGVARSVSI